MLVLLWCYLSLQAEPLRQLPPNESALQVPDGFRVRAWATGLGAVRVLAVADNGDLYASRSTGDVILLREGVDAAPTPKVVLKRPGVHGIAIQGNQVYVATAREILVAQRKPDGTLAPPKVLVSDLPDSKGSRALGVSPTGKLHVGAPENATMLRMKLDGTKRVVFASGLANTLAFAWHPDTLSLFGWDQADLNEELNLLLDSHDYSAAGTDCRKPELTYRGKPRASQMVFYSGSELPVQYRNDAFVAMRGSWNRSEPVGYKVVHVDFDEAGQPVAINDFVTGWLLEEEVAHFGRLAGLLVLQDGSLLLSEDTNGVIYRITPTAE